MCGHAVIALGRYAIDYNLVKPVSPVTRVNIQCPCGLVTAHVQYQDGQSGGVRFDSVPSYAFATDLQIPMEGIGDVHYDIAYGGAFYVFVDIRELKMDFETTPTRQLAEVGFALKKAVMAVVPVTHPESSDLAFLYGTIITDEREGSGEVRQICVFADGQVCGLVQCKCTVCALTGTITLTGGPLSLRLWCDCKCCTAVSQGTDTTRYDHGCNLLACNRR